MRLNELMEPRFGTVGPKVVVSEKESNRALTFLEVQTLSIDELVSGYQISILGLPVTIKTVEKKMCLKWGNIEAMPFIGSGDKIRTDEALEEVYYLCITLLYRGY